MENSNYETMQGSSSQPQSEKVDVNVYGVPISKNAGKVGSRIGKLVRMHVPISYESWKKVPQQYKDDVWTDLLDCYEIDSNAKDYFIKKMAESYRRHKSDLRTHSYDKYDNDGDRSKHCPRAISQDDWDAFLVNEGKTNAKERRELGKRNRSSYNYVHHTGHKNHASLEYEMTIANPSKDITRREVWENAHRKKDGTISDSASSYFEKISKLKETINDDEEEALQLEEDIITQVFGKDSRGRTRSIGSQISRTQVNASAVARKQLKKPEGNTEHLTHRIDNLEGTLNSVKDDVTMVLLLLKHGQTSNVDTNEGGSNQHNSLENSCELLNIDEEVIATGRVWKILESESSIMHGKSLLSTH